MDRHITLERNGTVEKIDRRKELELNIAKLKKITAAIKYPFDKILAFSDILSDGVYQPGTLDLRETDTYFFDFMKFDYYVARKEFYGSLYELEFKTLPDKDLNRCSIASKKENQTRNRSPHILPYDDTRFKLKPTTKNPDGYINASIIEPSCKSFRFIATQDPMAETVEDFWEMVWKSNCERIVMLSTFSENAEESKNCFKYFPNENESVTYGLIQVTLVEENSQIERCNNFVYRFLHLMKGDEEREVRHIHYTEWGPNDCPHNISNFKAFYSFSFADHIFTDPIIIHCSDGVGRTGTLLAIFIILFTDIPTNNLRSRFYFLRSKRMEMVQNIEQYIFIHHVVLEISYHIPLQIAPDDYESEFDIECSDAHYRVLRTLKTRSFKGIYSISTDEEKKHYSQTHRFIPVKLTDNTYEASVITNSNEEPVMMSAANPTENTMATFWHMVYERGCRAIVTLDIIYSTDLKWWPVNKCSMEFGQLTVLSKSETRVSESIILHCFSLNLVNKKSSEVFLYEFTKWPACDDSPDETLIMNLLVELMNCARNDPYKSLILFQCSNGADRSGLVACLFGIFRHLRENNFLDIYTVSKFAMRANPDFLYSKRQYKFLCEMSEYMIKYHRENPLN